MSFKWPYDFLLTPCQHITYLELHGGQLVQNLAHAVSDHTPRDLVFTLRC